jgi:preprotein translocase subunit YajC
VPVFPLLKPGDRVITPSGRIAVVMGFTAERVTCRYVDDREKVALQRKLLLLVPPKRADG